MAFFNFNRLIAKYGSNLTAITIADGHYDESGEWVKDETSETIIFGAVISHSENKIYRSEGALTKQDRRFFTANPINPSLMGAKAIYDGKVYSIENCSENAKFTGVYAYTLKYVSVFDKDGGGG